MSGAARIWQCGGHRLPVDGGLIMGVINTTPDSFSDGGCYEAPEAAYRHGMTLWEQGADILDVGGESTRPGAAAVGEEEEKRRVLPVIERLAAAGAIVSADTMKPAVMRAALDSGAAIINDVNGFRAAAAVQTVADSDCGLVVMHMRGQPRTMQQAPTYRDVVAEVGMFLKDHVARLLAGGVAAPRICVDPGIGFGKTREHNIALINQLAALANGLPLLAGISRKSIFAPLSGDRSAAARDLMSAVAAGLLLERGANILRVHNVEMTVQAIATWRLISGGALA